MSAIHPGNLHGTGNKTNKTRYHYARRRMQDAQKVKGEDENGSKKEMSRSKQSSNSVLVVLVVMIVVVWGVAASAYFGLINYKGILARGSNVTTVDAGEFIAALYPFQYEAVRRPLRSLGNLLFALDDLITNLLTFTEAPFEIKDKRRPVTSAPIRRMKKIVDLSTRDADTSTDSPAESSIPPSRGGEQTQEDVEQTKKTEQATEKPKESSDNKKPPEPKADDGGKRKTGAEPQAKEQKDESTKKKRPRTTSEEDKVIKEELKKALKMLDEKKGDQAWRFLKTLVEKNPESPKARYYRGKAEAMVAEQQRSNPMLSQAVKTFSEVVAMPNCPKELKKLSLVARGEKEQFLGRMKPALETQLELVKMYPQDIDVLNTLGVRFLMLGNNKKAKKVYEQVLKTAPNDGFALVHMGFIVKNEGDWAESIPYLKEGVESEAPGTQEGKFYFHLGDALHRTNKTKEAEKVYEKAAKKGLFRSKYQRSLYNIDRLRGKPFWTPEEAGVKDYVRRLEMNWKLIRDEALSVMDKEKGLFLLEEESLKDTGEWRQFTLFQRGAKTEPNCLRTPKTCNILERMPNARGCRRGQIKFSVMMPGTHVWPHTGPTNCRLRMHLGLVIPKTGSGARLACSGEMRTWEEGKVFIFDDSFEHEVWQEAESFRLILIVDIWHPDLTEHEKNTMTSI